ncbi:E3 ubiquitin-protein ligase RNF220-like [Arctopsyche grandis]|uniref:E3 ubiquitin-protein ligase RNF220-like n=1 Tax=Arctopsyche grandis TaxID=121162 RepID=UPI00406D6820
MFLSASYPPTSVEIPLSFTAMEQQQSSLDGETSGEETISAVRSRRRISELLCCPVCSCTLRPGELRSHLTIELDRLARLTTSPAKRRAGTPSTSSNGPTEADDVDTSGCTGSDVYERVKKNREKRLRACRGRNEMVTCPVCGRRFPTNGAEAHVDACLRKSSQSNDDDDESIDVEGEENAEEVGFGTSYEWCSQVRVRAAALQLRDGGDPPHGAMRIRRASTDTHLVVDGDEDDLLYGPPQYSPSRIAPQDDSMDFSTENLANTTESLTNGLEVTGESSFNNEINRSSGIHVGESSTSSGRRNHKETQNSCCDIVVQALKSRIRELELRLGEKNQRSETKCLICFGPYTEPVVSVQCWHVHCEVCWLASLSAKKTCPQCNAITTTQHLRRIYI